MLADLAMNYKGSVCQMSGAFPVNSNLLGVFPETLIQPQKKNNWCQKGNESNNKENNSNSALKTIDHRTVKSIT